MAGWSSANKYSLMGGLRAAGQLIAYELPLILAVVGVVIMAGTMSMTGIVEAQIGLAGYPLRHPGPVRRVRDLHDRLPRRADPDPLRHAHRRIGAGDGLSHRVLRASASSSSSWPSSPTCSPCRRSPPPSSSAATGCPGYLRTCSTIVGPVILFGKILHPGFHDDLVSLDLPPVPRGPTPEPRLEVAGPDLSGQHHGHRRPSRCVSDRRHATKRRMFPGIGMVKGIG